MKDLTKYLLEEKCFMIYRNGSNKAYLLSVTNDSGNIDVKEINYQVAEKLQIDNFFINYSPSMENACQYQFIIPHKVIEKVIDVNGNIIIIGDKLQNISLKIGK